MNTVLLARIEVLEAESCALKSKKEKPGNFRIVDEQIQHDDDLFQFYTGFISYDIFLDFYKFLGPAVNELNYWGMKESIGQRNYDRKLSPINQLFLTLVKLRLNLKLQDLAFRFGISTTSVSRYFTTWVYFLYQHLKELDWSPTVEQVMGTLPHSTYDICFY